MSPHRNPRIAAAIGLASLLVLGLGLFAVGTRVALPPKETTAGAKVLGKEQVKGSGSSRQQPPPSTSGTQTFSISGAVEGLTPGGTSNLPLRITNPHNFSIFVTTIRVTVGPAANGCAPSNVVASQYNGRLEVQKKASAPLTLTVRMVRDPASACAGATFPLTYSGTAVKK